MTVTVPRTESKRRWLFLLNKRMWLLIAATFGLVSAIYMGQVSQAALIGARVNEKQIRLARLNRENVQLQADIAVLLAPDRIEARAKALGLHVAKSEQIKYLTIKDYPVEPATLPSQSNTMSPAIDLQSWFQGLFQLFPNTTVHPSGTTNP